uniref:A-kinase anchor protein 14 n=1 Tax=Halichoerus grypus TaxID=9711 RepID=UPI001659ED0D|nr:A-kinase anchor protein 14 [Halichoerus grypus]
MDGTEDFKIQKMDVDPSPTSQETDTEEDNGNLNELALAVVKSAVSAAVKTVAEEEKPIKNIKWVTHGEFTAETGHKQIEEFILDMPIEVFYIFEGLSLVHRPGMTRFQEKWLRDIIEAKNILMESISF